MTDSTTQATDAATFRAQFPVFDQLSYLNAGTEGPVPASAVEAVHRRVDLEALRGRGGRPYFEGLMELRDKARDGYARAIGARPADVALTGSTTDGINTVIGGLDLRPGDEILTTDEEHPGLLAPLGRARRRHGITVRVVPFGEIADAVTPSTKLIACSHVSWVGGRIVDAAALSATGVPVLLDAAQAIGAIGGRRRGARRRLLRRLRAEVAVRSRGQRLPVRARGTARGAVGPVARVRVAGRPDEGARVRAGGGRRPAGPRLPERDAQRLDSRVVRGVRAGRLGLGP